jgi:ADP-ribosyl-[dinitrogen reductase] hydrolase
MERYDMKDRYLGTLLGLAAGDALGTTLEFEPRDSYKPLTDIIGGGPYGLRAGQWTDDTSMALCLAESILEKGWDPHDQMRRYVRWWREGVLSSTGTCFDIGNTVASALAEYEERSARGEIGGEAESAYCGSSSERASGNGSLMRLAPVPMRWAGAPAEAIEKCGESSRTTHQSRQSIDACRYYGGLIVGALRGESKETLLSPAWAPVAEYWEVHPLHPIIAAIAHGSWRAKEREAIESSGYVAHSLEAALWCFARTEDFRSGALMAANLGDDADTTAAIYGQLAGAFYGVAGIPGEWVGKLAMRERIEGMAEGLWDMRGEG